MILKMKIEIFVFALWLGVIAVTPANARYLDRGLAFGAFGGIGLGDAGWCDVACVSNYQDAHLLASLYYKWDPDHNLGLRFNVGGLSYLNDPHFSDAGTYLENILVEAAVIMTLTHNEGLFSPYLLGGVAWPSPIQLGIGNEFTLNDRMSILLEIAGSSFIVVDNHVDGRLGVMWHF